MDLHWRRPHSRSGRVTPCPWWSKGAATLCALAALAGCGGEPEDTAEHGSELSVVLTPAADTFVRSGSDASKNYGNSSKLEVDKNSSATDRAFLRFNVGAVGEIASARLRLYVINGSSKAMDVFGVSDTSWSETGTTWNNQPAVDGPLLGGFGSVSGGKWIEIDVTAQVRPGAGFAVALMPRSSDGIDLRSRQASSNKPQLVIATLPPDAGTGPSDAGSTDAGSTDAGGGDAGVDAGSPGGTDGGVVLPEITGPIEGVEPESHSHHPPLVDTQGQLYRIVESPGDDGNQSKMMKSTNGGKTWAEVSASNRPTSINDLEGTWQLQHGSTIWHTVTNDEKVWLTSFDTSDAPSSPDRWGATELVDSGLSTSGVKQFTSVSRTSDGKLWIFYSDRRSSDGRHHVAARRRNGANSYGAKLPLGSSDGSGSWTAPVGVTGKDDLTYVFYKDHHDHRLYVRTLSPTGSLSAAKRVDSAGTSIAAIPHTNAVSYEDAAGFEHIAIAFADSAGRFKSAIIKGGVVGPEELITATPVLQNPGITKNEGAVVHLALDGTTLHALWADQASGDVYLSHRPHDGGWSPPSRAWDSGAGEAHWVYGAVYTRAGARRLGFTYDVGPHADDTGNIVFREIAVPGGGSTGGGGDTGGGGGGTSNATLLFTGDFEAAGDFTYGGTYSQFNANVDSCEHDQTCSTNSLEIVNTPVRRGSRAVRMLLRDGDVQDTSGTRVELQSKGKFEQVLDDDYWYGWSIFVPNDWVFDGAQKVVHQWHTASGQPGGSPIIGLRIKNSNWRITREFEEGANINLLEVPVERGVWTDWVMHIRWSKGSSGRFRAWKNGTLVYEETGPNMNAGTTAGGHYQKFGMYGSFSGGLVSERTLYYDEIRVARGPDGYALVAP